MTRANRRAPLGPLAALAFVFGGLTGEASAGELYFFEHNGSVVEWFVVQDEITATYKSPRHGLAEAGVKPGSTLFKGRYRGKEIVGEAFAYKGGCEPAGYQVSGRQDGQRFKLAGFAPRWNGCRIERYSSVGRNAQLIFNYISTDH